MSFPHLTQPPLRLHPNGVRTSANIAKIFGLEDIHPDIFKTRYNIRLILDSMWERLIYFCLKLL